MRLTLPAILDQIEDFERINEGTALAHPQEQALARTRNGVEPAPTFEQFIALHELRVRRLAHRLLGWPGEGHGDVDDVVQDVFLAALKRLESFRGDSNVATWLSAVTINRCRTYHRRYVSWLNWFRRQRETTAEAIDRPVRDETSARVRTAIQELRPKDREVIVLFYLEEMSVAAMAKLLGAKANAIEVRLHRARQRLKEKLGDVVQDE